MPVPQKIEIKMLQLTTTTGGSVFLRPDNIQGFQTERASIKQTPEEIEAEKPKEYKDVVHIIIGVQGMTITVLEPLEQVVDQYCQALGGTIERAMMMQMQMMQPGMTPGGIVLAPAGSEKVQAAAQAAATQAANNRR